MIRNINKVVTSITVITARPADTITTLNISFTIYTHMNTNRKATE
jgi:hypothetical protein